MGIKGTAFDFSAFLVNSATIGVRTDSTDNMGGITTTWTASYTDEPCSLQGYVGQSTIVEKFGKAQESTTHIAIFNRVLTFNDGDRLTDEGGKIYMILGAVDEGGEGSVFCAYLRKLNEV